MMFGVLGLVIGLFFGGMMFLVGSMGMAAAAQDDSGAGWIAGMGVMAIILVPLIYGATMFVAGAIQALIYNFAAKFVGGIQIEAE